MTLKQTKPSIKNLHKQSGFSLLEIIVVLFLLGLIVSVVSFRGFSSNASDEVDEEASRLQVLIELASDFAVLNQLQMGLRIDLDDQSYEFVSLKDDKWLPIQDNKYFALRELPEDIKLELNLDNLPWEQEDALFDRDLFDENLSVSDESVQIGDEEDIPPPPPQILILSSGELTPFELIFSYEGYDDNVAPFYVSLQGEETIPITKIGPELL
ncbi:type II secretion system minor pseudopilin GspH [Agaribacter flavus]|uniref:Type II secretion system protein H n=1 Tax=Agaribacter flavus TaxID=1902781 RepID=A0ABV7FVZ5_9ALTE